jgi:type II secretory ATPase GspE/PulE/Tfp pilus assembly ATPase PilB-like protein
MPDFLRFMTDLLLRRSAGSRDAATRRSSRVATIALATLLFVAAGDVACAQQPPAAPSPMAQQYGAGAIERLSDVSWSALGKTAGLMLLVLMWAATGDWVNRDSQIFELGYKKWNLVVYLPVAALFLLLAFLPLPYVAKLPILFVAFLATAIPYVVVHNKNVQPHQTVLTGPWWRYAFAMMLGKLGVKVRTERQADYEKGAAVELMAMGAADKNHDNANLLVARQSPGYLLAKDLIVETVKRRSEKVHLEYQPQAAAVRYDIDGAWHAGEARDRESADVMLAVMKTLANLDPKERRKKQVGQFGAKYQDKTYLCDLSCQGVPNGERVLMILRNAKARPHTYESLGLREGLQQKWGELMSRDQGFLVFSTLPGGGLTTLVDASLDETDRLMRDFFAIEELHHREREIQNIAPHLYDATKGQTPASLIPTLSRQYPNVYVCRDLVDAESGKLLLDEIAEDRLVITTVRARDAAEALLRLLAMKLPQRQFAESVTGVLYQRLIRKLCESCKVGYQPTPDVLKKLGIPAGKVQQFYRPPKPEEVEKPCQACNGLGYVGRTGIFELLIVNDAVREILATQPTVEAIKKAARADQQRSLQEEGILLVAKGVTSLAELQRVLKGE